MNAILPGEAEEVRPLFELPAAGALPERLQFMYLYHGRASGQVCGTCRQLVRSAYGLSWAKCALCYLTNGHGTDWQASWAACGAWEGR